MCCFWSALEYFLSVLTERGYNLSNKAVQSALSFLSVVLPFQLYFMDTSYFCYLASFNVITVLQSPGISWETTVKMCEMWKEVNVKNWIRRGAVKSGCLQHSTENYLFFAVFHCNKVEMCCIVLKTEGASVFTEKVL